MIVFANEMHARFCPPFYFLNTCYEFMKSWLIENGCLRTEIWRSMVLYRISGFFGLFITDLKYKYREWALLDSTSLICSNIYVDRLGQIRILSVRLDSWRATEFANLFPVKVIIMLFNLVYPWMFGDIKTYYFWTAFRMNQMNAILLCPTVVSHWIREWIVHWFATSELSRIFKKKKGWKERAEIFCSCIVRQEGHVAENSWISTIFEGIKYLLRT